MSAIWRAFPPDIDELAQSWRDRVQCDHDWTRAGPPAPGGEARGFFVQYEGVTGYAKPGHLASESIPRPAHEKIAADLAFDLGLPVPPVVLWDRGEQVPTDQSRLTSVSAVPFDPVFTWGQVSRNIAAFPLLMDCIRPAASAMAAFDTWLDNDDRHSVDNVIVTYDGKATARSCVAFIDYSYSMLYRWKPSDFRLNKFVRVFPDMEPDLGEMRRAIDRIASTSEETIRQIVTRINPMFLDESQKDIITNGLLARRDRILELMRYAYPSLP